MTDSDVPSDRHGSAQDAPGGSPDAVADDGPDAERVPPGDGVADASDRRLVPRVVDAGGGSPDDRGEEESRREREPIEPGSPTPENALFVVLGVLATVALLATAVVPGVI